MTYDCFPIVEGTNEDIYVRDMPVVGGVHRVKIKCSCCFEKSRERLVNAQRRRRLRMTLDDCVLLDHMQLPSQGDSRTFMVMELQKEVGEEAC